MDMKIKLLTVFPLLSLVFLLFSGGGLAAEIKGVKFVDSFRLDQTELRLSGIAALKWALLFDVYAGAFYLPENHPASAWTADVPKRLELAYFRTFKADQFVASSDQLLRQNLSPEEYQVLVPRLENFLGLFREVRSGDRYSLNYRPGIGTELQLNDVPLGVAPGLDFAVAYFGIWLGAEPIDAGFRDRLLGVQ